MPHLETPRLVTGTRITVASEHGLIQRVSQKSNSATMFFDRDHSSRGPRNSFSSGKKNISQIFLEFLVYFVIVANSVKITKF